MSTGTSTGMSTGRSMMAVIVVRSGRLCAGAQEAYSEAGHRAVVVGEGAGDAARQLCGAGSVTALEGCIDDPAATAATLASVIPDGLMAVIVAGAPDGRDLAPRLALSMGRPLLAGAVRVRADHVVLVRTAGRVGEEVSVDRPFVATLVPGVRGFEPSALTPVVTMAPIGPSGRSATAVESLEVTPPDPATMDLAEAQRIVAGGQGLGSKERFDTLGAVGTAIGASLGGTRVASDAGWISFERQIGTTGVAVNPRVYLAFAISGATQHTSGLGHPKHIISVNTDATCPMMTMADLAIVSDAPLVLEALAARLLSP